MQCCTCSSENQPGEPLLQSGCPLPSSLYPKCSMCRAKRRTRLAPAEWAQPRLLKTYALISGISDGELACAEGRCCKAARRFTRLHTFSGRRCHLLIPTPLCGECAFAERTSFGLSSAWVSDHYLSAHRAVCILCAAFGCVTRRHGGGCLHLCGCTELGAWQGFCEAPSSERQTCRAWPRLWGEPAQSRGTERQSVCEAHLSAAAIDATHASFGGTC